jgi:hypothetical protein
MVRFPEHMLQHLEQEQARLGFRFSEAYARDSLERQTLVYYYEGLPVAYRSVPGGIEVLAVGYAETGKYGGSPNGDIKVVQR